MKKILFILGFIGILLPNLLGAAPPMQYEATVTTHIGSEVSTGHIYMDNGKMRVEAKVKGMDSISIVRPDQGRVYSVLPAQKTYVEVPVTSADIEMMAPYTDKTKFTSVGTEKMNGIMCDKLQMDTGSGIMFLWLDPKTQIPVLMQSEDASMKTEWKNVKVGPQNATLFEPPQGYQRLEMGSMMPGTATANQPTPNQPIPLSAEKPLEPKP